MIVVLCYCDWPVWYIIVLLMCLFNDIVLFIIINGYCVANVAVVIVFYCWPLMMTLLLLNLIPIDISILMMIFCDIVIILMTGIICYWYCSIDLLTMLCYCIVDCMCCSYCVDLLMMQLWHYLCSILYCYSLLLLFVILYCCYLIILFIDLVSSIVVYYIWYWWYDDYYEMCYGWCYILIQFLMYLLLLHILCITVLLLILILMTLIVLLIDDSDISLIYCIHYGILLEVDITPLIPLCYSVDDDVIPLLLFDGVPFWLIVDWYVTVFTIAFLHLIVTVFVDDTFDCCWYSFWYIYSIFLYFVCCWCWCIHIVVIHYTIVLLIPRWWIDDAVFLNCYIVVADTFVIVDSWLLLYIVLYIIDVVDSVVIYCVIIYCVLCYWWWSIDIMMTIYWYWKIDVDVVDDWLYCCSVFWWWLWSDILW